MQFFVLEVIIMMMWSYGTNRVAVEFKQATITNDIEHYLKNTVL